MLVWSSMFYDHFLAKKNYSIPMKI
jgi:hypothetical protein